MEMEFERSVDYSTMNTLEIDEKHVAALVDFVLLKATEEVWTGEAEYSDLTEIPNKKPRIAQAKKLFCVERNVDGEDDWEIIEYSPEDFDRDFVQAGDGRSTNKLPLEPSNNRPQATDNKLANCHRNSIEMPMRVQNKPRHVTTHTEEDQPMRKGVRLYVHDVITRALRQIADETTEPTASNISEHGMLFHSPSIGELGEPMASWEGQFIPPKIIIETVSDDSLDNLDNHGQDHLANDVVTVVLRSVVEEDPEGIATYSPFNGTDHSSDKPTISRERKRSSVTLEVLPDLVAGDNDSTKKKILERIPKLISVKRLIGFRRRNYTVNKKDKSEPPSIIVENGDTKVKHESVLKKGSPEKECQKSPTNPVVTESSSPPRKSKPFSRRIVSRLFGGKQNSPALSSLSSQKGHG